MSEKVINIQPEDDETPEQTKKRLEAIEALKEVKKEVWEKEVKPLDPDGSTVKVSHQFKSKRLQFLATDVVFDRAFEGELFRPGDLIYAGSFDINNLPLPIVPSDFYFPNDRAALINYSQALMDRSFDRRWEERGLIQAAYDEAKVLGTIPFYMSIHQFMLMFGDKVIQEQKELQQRLQTEIQQPVPIEPGDFYFSTTPLVTSKGKEDEIEDKPIIIEEKP